jgi:amino acid adenylation domain-containing protein
MKNEKYSDQLAIAAAQNTCERDYWLEKLAGSPVKSFFPCDRNEEAGKKPVYETRTFQFTGELATKLLHLGNRYDYMIFMIFITAVTVLVEKYTGSKDIIIASPIYKQETDGNFVNTVLPIRNKIAPAMTFKDLLLQVKSGIIEANENQNYPLETLLYHLDMPLQDNNCPLFDIAVLLGNIHDERYIEHIQFKTSFIFHGTGNTIDGTLKYDSLKYGAAAIDRIINHLTTLLKQTLFNLEIKVEDIDLFSAEEKKQLLVDFNGSKVDYPRDKTICELYRERVEERPDNILLVFCDKQVTYKELNRRANRLARHLRIKGAGAENIVGIMVERSPGMIEGLMGILKAGGAFMSIDPQYPGERVKYMLEDSGAVLLLTHKHWKGQVEGAVDVDIIDLSNETIYAVEPGSPGSLRRSGKEIQPHIEPGNLAYVIYTSGSTGKPKGVLVEHQSIVNTLLARRDYYQLDHNSIILQIVGYTFDSSVTDIFNPLVSGSKLVLIPPGSLYDLQYLGKIIKQTAVTYFIAVPGLYKSFLLEIAENLKELKQVVLAGDNISEKLVQTHFDLLNHVKLYNEYGPSENSVCSTFYEFKPPGAKVLVGIPLPNVSCYLLSTEGKLVPIGVPGEIYLAGRGLAREYLKRPELTKEKFLENPFIPGERMYRTGDLARRLADGNLEFLGRIDNQVKIRGCRVELGEIENRIIGYKDIKEAVVIAHEGAPNGPAGFDQEEKYLCAYIAAEKEIDITGLRNSLEKTIPAYMIPAFFMQIDRIPLDRNGKVNRKALPAPSTAAASRELTGPRDQREKKLAQIWQEILGKKENNIDIKDDFFQVGGNSLNAIRLINKIHKEFDTKITIAGLLTAPTIEKLAEYLKNAKKEKYFSIENVEKKEFYPLSSAQKRMFIQEQKEEIKSDILHNMPRIFTTDGILEKEKIESVFKKLLQRHEALRTSFHFINGEPLQKIHDHVPFNIRYIQAGDEDIETRIKKLLIPFDLGQAPLFRVTMMQLQKEKHILIFDIHHIISDGVSMGILIKEFAHLYEGKHLEPLTHHYKDYAAWENGTNGENGPEKYKDYWLKQLENFQYTRVPPDHVKPGRQGGGQVESIAVEPEIYKKIENLCNRYGTTKFVFMLTIFKILLTLELEQDDITIGSPVSSRDHYDLKGIMGMMINFLVLRSKIDRRDTFREMVLKMKETTINAMDNRYYPYELLHYELRKNMNFIKSELFSIMFNFYSFEEDTGKIENTGINLSPYGIEETHPLFDIILYVRDDHDRMNLDLEYKNTLYTNFRMKRILQMFHDTLIRVLEDDSLTIDKITDMLIGDVQEAESKDPGFDAYYENDEFLDQF